MITVSVRGSGEISRFGDSLRAGRSGDAIPVEAKFSAPVQTGPGDHPAFCRMGTGLFPRVKSPGRGVEHPPHLVGRFHPFIGHEFLRESRGIALLYF